MKRLERLQAMILEFKSRRVITAQQLSDEFGVNLRTVYRDVKSLKTSGYPIEGEAGVGYRLEKNFVLSPVVLSEEEGVALLTAAKFVKKFPDRNTQDHFESALKKIQSVLPENLQDKMDFFTDYLEVLSQPSNEPASLSNELFSKIRQALYESKIICLNYQKGKSEQIDERFVEPLGLVFYSYHWHLIAWCRLRQDYRDFRLDRIQGLDLTEERYQLHQRMNLKEYGELQMAQLSIFYVSVSFNQSVVGRVNDYRYLWGYTGKERVEGEWVQMDFAVPHLESFARWLLSFTSDIKVIESNELKKVYERLIAELL